MAAEFHGDQVIDTKLLANAFGLTEGWLRQQMLRELDSVEQLPTAVGRILIFADAVLPGCISRIAKGVAKDELGDLLVQLEREDPFNDELIASWLRSDGAAYPSTASYLLSLDAVRRWSIDLIKDRQFELGQSAG